MRYSEDQIASHIRQKHPGCPEFAVAYFAAEISSKNWEGASIGKAVGITMQNYLRHHMTDYDALLRSGIDRQEARKGVQPRINAMLRSWKKTQKGTESGAAQRGFQ